jgi:uncharacterized membrane protein YeaQ/YmgE (transglycosylase-associated protein family)
MHRLLKGTKLSGNSIIGFTINLLMGAIAGLIVSQFTRAKERDVSLSVLLGIAGAIVGSHVAQAMGFPFLGEYRDNVAAAAGALFFLLGWHGTRRTGRQR